MIKAVVLTISDSCVKGQREDVSGNTIIDILKQNTFDIFGKGVVADKSQAIATELIGFSDEAEVDIVFTTGAQDLGSMMGRGKLRLRHVKKMLPGLAELMRSKGLEKTPNGAMLR